MKHGIFDYLVQEGTEGNLKSIVAMHLDKGHMIYRPPHRNTPIFEIVTGAVKIGTYSPEGLEVCYDILKPGDFFGNLQYLDGQFAEFAKTLTPTELRSYDLDQFKKYVTEQPILSDWFIKELVARWCRAEDRLYAVRSLGATEKIKRILPYFQDQITNAAGKTLDLMKLITFQDIADLTGLTRQTVSKVMQKDFFDLPNYKAT